MFPVDKIETDNPFVDLIVYYVKLISLNLVIKNEQEANKNETLDSLKAAELFMSCYEGTAVLGLFESIPREVCDAAELPCLSDRDYEYYSKVENIPPAYTRAVLTAMQKYYVDNYVELNPYYRELNGLPPLKDIEESQESKINNSIKDPLIDVSEYLSGYTDKSPYYIHECTEPHLNILIASGVMDSLIEQYPDKKYLEFLRDGRINLYTARKAERFQLLRIPNIDNQEVLDDYKAKYILARAYTLKTVYSDAYAFESLYYDSFISVFIVLQTMIDMLSDIQAAIARKDIFDARSIKWMFQSYGIPYYDEIPLKYQKRMLKNLNTLLKYKSSTRNIVDICSLFGFDDIQVFKYYILKYRKVDENNNYIFGSGKEEEEENPEDYFELKFIKVPIDEFDPNPYAKDNSSHIDYEDLAYNDAYWQEAGKEEDIKKEILDAEFSVERDKYLSIDVIYNLSQLTFDVSYFYSMLMDKWNCDMEELVIPYITVPYISQHSFKLIDIIIYLISLSYEYYGFKDYIMDENIKTMYVYGFNFGVDMYTFIDDIRYQLELHRLPQFIVESVDNVSLKDYLLSPATPDAKTITYDQLMNVFNTNKGLHDLVVYMMRIADNKRTYDIYKKIYTSLMITDKTVNFFKDKSGNLPTDPSEAYGEIKAYHHTIEETIDATIVDDQIVVNTPKEYVDKFFLYGGSIKLEDSIPEEAYEIEDNIIKIKDKSKFKSNKLKVTFVFDREEYEVMLYNQPTYSGYLLRKGEAMDLYNSIADVRAISDMEGKRKVISDIMNNVTIAMDEYIDSDEYKYLYTIMPANTANVIQQYMMKIINFFKSFRIDFAMTGTIYKLDDKFNNLMRLIDDTQLNAIFDKNELIPIFDYVDSLVTLTKKEKISLLEKLKIDRQYILEYEFSDNLQFKEEIERTSSISRDDELKYTDDKEYKSIFEKIDSLRFGEKVEINRLT